MTWYDFLWTKKVILANVQTELNFAFGHMFMWIWAIITRYNYKLVLVLFMNIFMIWFVTVANITDDAVASVA